MARYSTELTREELEKDEDRRLAPFAMRSMGARRAVPLEWEGRLFDYRTEFQRDRDRILHSRAFRRLRLKSHGGAIPPAERYRDRLTHTLEVSQLSRTVARGLGLNEDLVEAIALGHDLGMPPFGRAGETALALLMAGRAGGFRHNEQSLRVVDRVEKRYENAGLNLTDRTREGILKHAGPGSYGRREDGGALHPDWAPFFEAQVVGAVDEAASVVQDLDDGLRAGEVDLAQVEALPIVKELMRRVEPAAGRARESARRPRATGSPGKGGLFRIANVINRGLTHMLVIGIIHHSRRSIRGWVKGCGVESHAQFLAARGRVPADIVGMAPPARRLFDGLKSFVVRHIHQGAALSAVAARAGHIVTGLFRALTGDPRLADDYLLLRFKQEQGGRFLRDIPTGEMDKEIARRYRGGPSFARLVADHIAGMTDLYAIAEYERLLGPIVMGAPGGGRLR